MARGFWIGGPGRPALAVEVPRGAVVPNDLAKLGSEPPKHVSLRVGHLVGETVKATKLEIILIGALETLKYLEGQQEWEDALGNIVGGAVKVAVASALGALAVVGLGVFMPFLAAGGAVTIVAVALAGTGIGVGLDGLDDDRLGKHFAAAIRFLKDPNFDTRPTPGDIHQIDDKQFWDMMSAAKMRL
jgi:hypothetical protein